MKTKDIEAGVVYASRGKNPYPYLFLDTSKTYREVTSPTGVTTYEPAKGKGSGYLALTAMVPGYATSMENMYSHGNVLSKTVKGQYRWSGDIYPVLASSSMVHQTWDQHEVESGAITVDEAKRREGQRRAAILNIAWRDDIVQMAESVGIDMKVRVLPDGEVAMNTSTILDVLIACYDRD